MTSSSLMHKTGPWKPVHWDDPAGWDGEGGGRGFRDGGHIYTHVHLLIHVNVWQKPPQYCKVIILQLKLINSNEKKEKGKGLAEV